MKQPTELKKRLWLLTAACLVLVFGLASRSSSLPVPTFLAKYAGDALWAVLVFLLIAITCPRRPVLWLASVTITIAYSVELLQLYQAPWLNAIRSTLPGRLVLGRGFLFSDLLCYTVGVGLVAVIYQAVTQRHLRDFPAIVGGGLGLTVAVAIIACNVGQGGELFSFVDQIPGHDKTGHFLLMGALSFFLVWMIAPRMKTPPWKATRTIVITLSVVISLEEGSQQFLSNRSFSIADGLCSLAGIIFFGSLAGVLVNRGRSK